MTCVLNIGITHRTAPLALRDRLLPVGEETDRIADSVARAFGESLALRTCGRFEVYLAPRRTRVKPERMAARIAALVARLREVPVETVRACAHVYLNEAAIEHALRVAAGLDSQILGEEQVLGQVRHAFTRAASRGTVGPILSALMRGAIHAGRRVRAESGLLSSRDSFARLAVLAVNEAFPEGAGRLVIVGSGTLAAEIVAGMGTQRRDETVIVGRHAARVERLARSCAGKAAGFDELSALTADADAVVACTSASRPVLTHEMLRSRSADVGQPERRLLLVDLGMPRNIDPRVAELPGVSLLNLDDLASRFDATVLDDVRGAIARAERVLDQEHHRFRVWLAARELRGQSAGHLRNAKGLPDSVRSENRHSASRDAPRLAGRMLSA